MENQDSKKTTGLLITTIRTLTQGANPEQRKGEKQRLEKAYLDSDKRLNGLVQVHMNELTSIIKAFSEISTRVTTAQNRVHAIRDNLQSCKNLLLCKRGELQQLWLDGIECKTTVTMLEQIQEIHNVAEKLHGFMEHKHYLHATQLLVKAASLFQNDLADVGALVDLKTELSSKKEEIFDRIMDELSKHIYVRTIRGVEKNFQRDGSQRQSQRSGDKTNRTSYVPAFEQESQAEKQVKQLLAVDLVEVLRPHQVTEDITVGPDEDPVQYLAVLIECLALLRRLMDSVDLLRGNIKSGLLNIITRASQQVADSAYIEGEDLSQLYQPSLLNDLLSLVYQQFEVVLRVHQIILANMQRIKHVLPPEDNFELYDIGEVWLKMQEVMQQLLSEYLDTRHAGGYQTAVAAQYEPNKDMNFYFMKKRPKPPKFALFRFDASSHAISMTSYLREQRQDNHGSEEMLNRITEGDGGRPVLVCKPGATNITSLYMPLQKFMKDMENNISALVGLPSPLQAFLGDFISHVFLTQVHEKITAAVSDSTQGDARRLIIDHRTQNELGVPVPLLQSAVVVAKGVEELQTLMEELPNYKTHFVSLACSLLNDYRIHCQKLFESIIAVEQDDKKPISVTWARDEDISRLVKSLPSWSLVKLSQQLLPEYAATVPPRWVGIGATSAKSGDPQQAGEDEDEDVHDADQRALMVKESSLLTANLSSALAVDDIISNSGLLQTLASLCESLEWCALRVEQFIDDLSPTHLPSSSTGIKSSPSIDGMTTAAINTLKSLAQVFQEQSELCLLILHLEVRVHCFYYLLPLPKQSNYFCAIDDMDPDVGVTRHNKDLTNLDEIMRSRVEPKKFRYIFDGLGHLVSSILINHAQQIQRINENGIKKLCRNILALQQCIAGITLTRESDLDHARQYYELLYLRPQEVTKLIRERGIKFSEPEYVNLLKLKCKSEKGVKEDAVLNDLIDALRDAPRR